MSGQAHRELICKGFCSFYRPGKEELKCGAYAFLERTLSTGELQSTARRANLRPDVSLDSEMRKLVCERCDFLNGGCGSGKTP
jgi:hypothetical protein